MDITISAVHEKARVRSVVRVWQQKVCGAQCNANAKQQPVTRVRGVCHAVPGRKRVSEEWKGERRYGRGGLRRSGEESERQAKSKKCVRNVRTAGKVATSREERELPTTRGETVSYA